MTTSNTVKSLARKHAEIQGHIQKIESSLNDRQGERSGDDGRSLRDTHSLGIRLDFALEA
ncbi:MAG: hypothetical protein GXP21_05185 [Gammaproteobacteria bacterium]|nr:hypothetical protein [Gammaproteobacteria bacterium]